MGEPKDLSFRFFVVPPAGFQPARRTPQNDKYFYCGNDIIKEALPERKRL